MSGTTYKTSRAYIRPAAANQRFVRVLDSQNPEVVLSRLVREFFDEMGYSEMFPNFNNLRVGTVHPFAIMLAQDILEQPKTANLFPSITITDSNATEDSNILGDDREEVIFRAADMATLDGYRQAKEIHISDTAWAKMQAVVASIGYIVGTKRTFRTRSSIDFNIWSENKDITSFLFDMVTHFIVQKKSDIHTEYSMDVGSLSGRRTGDINLDFGMLLYGANVQVSAVLDHSAAVFDTSIGIITTIDTITRPDFHTTQ